MSKVREPSNIIEMVEMIESSLSTLSPKSYDKQALESARVILKSFQTMDFYEISSDVYDAAIDHFFELHQGKKVSDIKLDHDARLPSNMCGFWWPGSMASCSDGLRIPVMLIVREISHLENLVFLVGSDFEVCEPMGGYSVGEDSQVVVPPQALHNDNEQHYSAATLKIAALCSLINQPSFLKTETVGSRQQRRAAQRKGGYSPEAWRKVTWNIGEEVKAKLTRDEPVRCMPLHYTRGHWRRAEEGWKNTTLRKDGLWYQWIEGFWSGHPAFGIKKAYHAPKMGDAA